MNIREAQLKDVPRLEQLRVRAWQDAYPGLVEQEVLDELDADDPVAHAVWRKLIENVDVRVAVAENEGGGMIGFCAVAGPSRDRDEPPGVVEIISLNVDPAHQGIGAGRALSEAVLTAIRESDREWRECTVWTLERNQRALALYESLGFRRDGHERTDERWLCPDVRLRMTL